MDLTFLILLGFFALMYFVMIRPQQKRQKQQQEMLANLTVDDDVITIGGLHGTIVGITDETVDLMVTDDVTLRFQRSSVAKVVGDEEVALDTGESTTDA